MTNMMPGYGDFPADAVSPQGRRRRRRVAGALLIVAGILIVLSLVSYSAEEVSWAFLNPGRTRGTTCPPCTDWLGIVGLYTAGLLYRAFGAGAVFGALLLQGPGWGLLLYPEEKRCSQWVAAAVMMICACAVLSVQPWVLWQWAAAHSAVNPGGGLGYLDGSASLQAVLGTTTTLVLLLSVHAVALIYYARLTPRIVFHTWLEDAKYVRALWRERRRRRRERREADLHAWRDDVPPLKDRRHPLPEVPVRNAEPGLGSGLPPVHEQPRDFCERQPHSAERPAVAQSPPREHGNGMYRAAEPARAVVEPQQRERESDRSKTSRPQQRQQGTGERPRNLLDLMQNVEDEIERENDYPMPTVQVQDEDDTEELPINPHTQQAIARHFGYPLPQVNPDAPAEQGKAPAVDSAPHPAPAVTERQQDSPVLSPEKRAAALPENPLPTADYPMPPYDLLRYEPVPESVRAQARQEMEETQAIIADTLESFRINVEPGEITRGPSVTRYEFSLPRGQSVRLVSGKAKDIMAATCSTAVNILAPIPGKSTVGVELENGVKEPVYLRELLLSAEFRNPKLRLPIALGKDVYGKPLIGDLAAMPHVLVAGTTGSGKSVCINNMLISFLYKFRPEELKLILVDPKVVEMQPYEKLPHLAVPVVTNPAHVISALRWAVNEMEHRYRLFSKTGVRNLEDFNALPPEARLLESKPHVSEPEPPPGARPDFDAADAIVRDVESSQGYDIPQEDEDEADDTDAFADDAIPEHIPYIVIVIDELADLMMQVKEDLENYIGRLTQKARAAGIHLIVATQTPRANVVTGPIKANLPSRIALKVSGALDSRVILDESGAENLLGRGDLLFLPPSGPSKMARAQGAFVSDAEIASIIQFCAAHAQQNFVRSVSDAMRRDEISSSASGTASRFGSGGDDEELYTRCMNLVVTERKASTSLLQRRFSIGYGKAAKIMDLLEERGVISSAQGQNRPREVLIDKP